MELGTMGQVLINGLMHGAVLSLVAVGVALIFGTVRVINLAQGELVAIGSYVGVFAVGSYALPLWLALPAALVLGFALGWVLQRVVLREVASRSTIDSLLLTFGLSTLVIGLLSLLFTTNLRGYESPIGGSAEVLGISLPYQSLVIGLTALGLLALLLLIIFRTASGAGLRAVAQHRDAAAACGVDLRRADGFAFGLGCALAVGGGLMLSIRYTTYPNFGEQWLLQAIIAAVIGGLTSIFGALAGSMLLGVIFTAVAYWAGSSDIASLTLYLLFTLLILVRGGGLLGREA